MSLIIQLLASISMSGFAAFTEVVPIQEVELADRLTTEKNIVLRAGYYYPNGCYESKRSIDREGPNGEKIILKHEVYVRDGLCTMAIVYDQSKFHLEGYEEGTYNLVDAYDRETVGQLYVDEEGEHKVIELQ